MSRPTRATKVTSPPARAAADRLVGAFAAGGGDELAAQDGFARPRNAVELDDHVGVGTADDEDAGLCYKLVFRIGNRFY